VRVDHGQQPGILALGVLGEAGFQVVCPAEVVPGVPVGPVEVQQVDGADGTGRGGHCEPPHSVTQAIGQAVPQARQVSAVSVRPSPVSTSPEVMSSEPQSGR
jgi:hypothetical protein